MSHYKKMVFNINVLQQTACLVVNTIMAYIFVATLFKCTTTEMGLRLYDGSDFKTSVDERFGMLLWLWSGPQGFNCWISFARVFSCMCCWVLISLLFLFISWFVCTWSWTIEMLEIFYASQTSMCLDPHQNEGLGLRRLSPSVKFCWPL